MKNKMPIEKKVKLIYSGELILIALVVLVIGILKLVDIIPTNPTRLLVYNIITIIGGAVLLGDFCWAIFSKKRRPKVSLLDKCLALPAALYLIAFDIVCFIQGASINDRFVVYSIGLVLVYIGAIYIFQGIYHYFHLTPQLLEAIKEEEERELEESKVEEETAPEEPKEESKE